MLIGGKRSGDGVGSSAGGGGVVGDDGVQSAMMGVVGWATRNTVMEVRGRL